MFFLQLLLQGNGNLVFLIFFFLLQLWLLLCCVRRNCDVFFFCNFDSFCCWILCLARVCLQERNTRRFLALTSHVLGKSIALWVINNIMRHALFSGLFFFLKVLIIVLIKNSLCSPDYTWMCWTSSNYFCSHLWLDDSSVEYAVKFQGRFRFNLIYLLIVSKHYIVIYI